MVIVAVAAVAEDDNDNDTIVLMLLMMMMATLNFCCCCRDDLLNQIQTRNRIEVILYIKGTNQDKDDKRTGEGKEVIHSFCKKEKYRLSCRTRLDSIHTLYGTSSNTIQERRRMYSGIIIIRTGSIGRYIIHSIRHTILIATQNHHHHKWLLHCHPCTKSSIPTLHHYIIEQSPASPECTYMLGIIV